MYTWQREYWYWYLRWLRGYVPLAAVCIALPATLMPKGRSSRRAHPSLAGGADAVWVSHSSDTVQGARPRSAVTVSLPAPALARLTRTVRAKGRVDPGSSPGTGASAAPLRRFVVTTSLGFTANVPLCLTILLPQERHRAGPRPVGGSGSLRRREGHDPPHVHSSDMAACALSSASQGVRGVGEVMRSKTVALRFRCIFAGSYVREHIDPKINDLFRVWGVKPNWGDMRQTWRIKHCAELNPYGSADCPFTERQCANAFYDAVQETLRAEPRRFGALFRYVAHRTGQERADDAQGSRHRGRVRRGDIEGRHPSVGEPSEVVRPGKPVGVDGDVPPGIGESLRGTGRGPIGLGSLLGSLDLRSRPPARRGDTGEEGSE